MKDELDVYGYNEKELLLSSKPLKGGHLSARVRATTARGTGGGCSDTSPSAWLEAPGWRIE